MAVKRLPAGVNVDMGFSEESPMDKLNNLLSTAGNIAAGVGAIREQRNTEQLNTITMLNEAIDRARSPQELERVKSMVDDIPFNYHNDSINLAAEAVRVKHAQSSEDFRTVQSLGDQITAEMTKMLKFKNKDGEEISKSFQNMTFTMSDGTKIKTPEFLAKMGSYGDSMDTMINALGNDGVLSVEEAQAIIDGDSKYYNQLRKEKGDNLRIRIPQLNRSLDSISKEIAKLEKPNADVAQVISLLLQDPDLANNATLVNKLSLLSSSSINTIEDLATDEEVVGQPNKVLTTLKETKDLLNAEYQKQLVIADAWGFEDAYGKPAEFIKDRMPRKNGEGGGDGATTIDVNKNFIQSFPFKEANKDSLPVINNNPGNLKFANQSGSVEDKQGFAKFDNIEDGWQALYNQIDLDVERGDTIESFVKGHPELDYSDAYSTTDQDEYVKFLQQKLKVSKNTLLKDVDRTKLVQAVSQMEGYLDSKTGIAPTESQLQAAKEVTPKKDALKENVSEEDAPKAGLQFF